MLKVLSAHAVPQCLGFASQLYCDYISTNILQKLSFSELIDGRNVHRRNLTQIFPYSQIFRSCFNTSDITVFVDLWDPTVLGTGGDPPTSMPGDLSQELPEREYGFVEAKS